MNAIDDGWEQLLVSNSENLSSPRSNIFMAGLSRDELVIIGGIVKSNKMADGYILDIPKMRLKTVLKNTYGNITIAADKN